MSAQVTEADLQSRSTVAEPPQAPPVPENQPAPPPQQQTAPQFQPPPEVQAQPAEPVPAPATRAEKQTLLRVELLEHLGEPRILAQHRDVHVDLEQLARQALAFLLAGRSYVIDKERASMAPGVVATGEPALA